MRRQAKMQDLKGKNHKTAGKTRFWLRWAGKSALVHVRITVDSTTCDDNTVKMTGRVL